MWLQDAARGMTGAAAPYAKPRWAPLLSAKLTLASERKPRQPQPQQSE
jgi:hypothetical protein